MIDTTILAALIGVVGSILAALLERNTRMTRRTRDNTEQILGLQNGTRAEAETAIGALARERVERDLR